MQLIATMIKLEKDKVAGKLELAEICRGLMPNGKPNYLAVIKFPMIKSLIESQGFRSMHKVVFLLVKDFCNSFNVVRNMTEEQMIETASMLLDECDNFRLEDYVMMFQMGKRGELFDVHDRIDLQVIIAMLDKYWQLRHEAGESVVANEINHIDTLGNTSRLGETIALQDFKLMEMSSGYSSAINRLKDTLEEKVGNKEERQRLKEIEIADTAAIQQKKKELGIND